MIYETMGYNEPPGILLGASLCYACMCSHYELFLLQRDVPGGMTQPALKRDWNYTNREIDMASNYLSRHCDAISGHTSGGGTLVGSVAGSRLPSHPRSRWRYSVGQQPI